MIDLSIANEWQHICPDTGLVMPWYTKPALDEIVTWDMKDKVVLEIGGGASTLWWTRKARMVYLIEDDTEYWQELFRKGLVNLFSAKEKPNGPFDIVIVDSDPVHNRDALCKKALNVLKPGGALIIDNWDQPSVWMPNQLTKDIILPLEHKVFRQENHPDWQTLIAWKPL